MLPPSIVALSEAPMARSTWSKPHALSNLKLVAGTLASFHNHVVRAATLTFLVIVGKYKGGWLTCIGVDALGGIAARVEQFASICALRVHSLPEVLTFALAFVVKVFGGKRIG